MKKTKKYLFSFHFDSLYSYIKYSSTLNTLALESFKVGEGLFCDEI